MQAGESKEDASWRKQVRSILSPSHLQIDQEEQAERQEADWAHLVDDI